jgi:hypothetical protein
MNPGDLIEVELADGRNFFWKVSGIYLGGLNQESVIQIEPLDQKANTQRSPTLVPAQLLDMAIAADSGVRIHSAANRTERESSLLEALYRANEMLRSCKSVVERRGDNTNWEPFERELDGILSDQHRIIRPLRFEKIERAKESLMPRGECAMSPDEGTPKKKAK